MVKVNTLFDIDTNVSETTVPPASFMKIVSPAWIVLSKAELVSIVICLDAAFIFVMIPVTSEDKDKVY
ncbi:hypothetical protein D3C71_1095550 [compost metagenome]